MSMPTFCEFHVYAFLMVPVIFSFCRSYALISFPAIFWGFVDEL